MLSCEKYHPLTMRLSRFVGKFVYSKWKTVLCSSLMRVARDNGNGAIQPKSGQFENFKVRNVP